MTLFGRIQLGRRRSIALGVLTVALASAVAWRYAPVVASRLPFKRTLAARERAVRDLRKKLKRQEKFKQKRAERLARLRELARPFRRFAGRTSAADVKTEFDKLLRKSQVTPLSVRLLRQTPEKYSEFVLSVELAVQIRASMREISRLLAQLEKDRGAFFWKSCSIRPDNPRDPHQVVLSGRLQALFLSPAAQKVLFEEQAP